MQRTKIIIALVAVAALTLAIVGLASAQIVTQPSSTTSPGVPFNNGFWGWIGNCFGIGANQAYGSQNVVPQASTDGSSPAPTPYQGGYGYEYGFGPCWAR